MNLTPELIQHMVTTMTKTERQCWIQEQGYEAWKAAGSRGTEEMATGTGKTRIGIRAAKEELETNPDALVYVVVPTETLRDVGWPEEARAYGCEWVLEKVRIVCWAALGRERPPRDVDLVILDEVHHITTLNSSFFSREDYKVWKIMGLTATLPGEKWQQDIDKMMIIKHLCPPVFKITLEQAIALKIVTDFEMYVLKFDLDDTEQYIEVGAKGKTYKTTELKRYHQLTKMMQRATFSKNEGMKFVAIQKRTEFLYNLRTKKRLAQDVIRQIMTKGERTIFFCGSIEQSEELCGRQVYHSRTNDLMLEAFRKEEIDYLGVVQALNEGENLPNIDQILVVQLTSKELNIIQRIGRAIRWRENHTPKVIVLVAKGTADEKWYKEAIRNFDKSRIKEYYVKPEAERQ